MQTGWDDENNKIQAINPIRRSFLIIDECSWMVWQPVGKHIQRQII